MPWSCMPFSIKPRLGSDYGLMYSCTLQKLVITCSRKSMCMQALQYKTTESTFQRFIELDSVMSYEAVVLKTANKRRRSTLRLRLEFRQH